MIILWLIGAIVFVVALIIAGVVLAIAACLPDAKEATTIAIVPGTIEEQPGFHEEEQR